MLQNPRSFSKEPQPRDHPKTLMQQNLQEMMMVNHPSQDNQSSDGGEFRSEGVDEDYYTQE